MLLLLLVVAVEAVDGWRKRMDDAFVFVLLLGLTLLLPMGHGHEHRALID